MGIYILGITTTAAAAATSMEGAKRVVRGAARKFRLGGRVISRVRVSTINNVPMATSAYARMNVSTFPLLLFMKRGN